MIRQSTCWNHTTNSIWISDEILSAAFRRFASSVPGPMESRRRLGKRRIAHLSETVHPQISHPVGLWGRCTEVDRTKWRWEPPKSKATKQDAPTPVLPAWLLELDNITQGEAGDIDASYIPEPAAAQDTTDLKHSKICSGPRKLAIEDVHDLRESIRNARLPQELEDPYSLFLRQLGQSLTLGLVSGETLEFTLRSVTRDLEEVSARWGIPPTPALSQLFTTVWGGISACKVLQPHDFNGTVMDSLLSLLSILPFTTKVRNLASDILTSTSHTQHLDMERSTKRMVIAWSESWVAEEPSQTEFKTAMTAIVDAERHLELVHRRINGLMNTSISKKGISINSKIISGTRSTISLASDAISKAEHILWPRFRASTRKLADALDKVPQALLPPLISSISHNISTRHVRDEYYMKRLRYCWLSTVAQISSASYELFVGTWQKMDTLQRPFSERECCKLVLDYWIRRGLVNREVEVTAWFQCSYRQDFAALLLSLEKYTQQRLARTRMLFVLLDDLGRGRMLYKIMSRMNSFGLKIPIAQIALLLEIAMNYSPEHAIGIYRLHSYMRLGSGQLSKTFLGNFMTALINHPEVNLDQIWELLEIPIYANHEGRRFRRSHLDEESVEFFHNMISTMAQSEFRRSRVILRNISQCLYHLRLHNAPILPKMSKAFAEVGITREIKQNKYVGQERLRYVISMIAKVEGKPIADQVDEMVYAWREILKGRLEQQWREENVLRVGLID